MNAPVKINLEAAVAPSKQDGITVRNRRFGRDDPPARWWLDGNPVATAWHIALSATFPRGEALFIEAVKAHRDGADPRLTQEIRAFVKQEVNHTREHIAFNRGAESAGYDLSRIDARVEQLIGSVFERKPIAWLAITIALEHFTAMFAHEFLTHPEHFQGGDREQVELWRWHAAEEIEHKGVAYDTWLHATKGWSRWRRWKVKTIAMLHITRSFIINRSRDCADLLEQDGITGWRAKWRMAAYLIDKPGILRRVFPQWCAYFMPGFHPWNVDDRALIALYDSEYEAARMPAH